MSRYVCRTIVQLYETIYTIIRLSNFSVVELSQSMCRLTWPCIYDDSLSVTANSIGFNICWRIHFVIGKHTCLQKSTGDRGSPWNLVWFKYPIMRMSSDLVPPSRFVSLEGRCQLISVWSNQQHALESKEMLVAASKQNGSAHAVRSS